MTVPAWTFSLGGGALIGLSASIAWSRARQVTGVSGILGAMLRQPSARGFRAGFLGSLLATSVLLGSFLAREVPGADSPPRPILVVIVAGLLVGFGTQLGGGCTSGHGVCGVSRLSPRSLVATAVFMLSAAAVVAVTRHIWAGIGL